MPETFTWDVPENVPAGEIVITATVYYSKLVSSVAKYLGVPAEEAAPVEICREVVRVTVS